MAVINWETAQERCQIQHREGDEIQCLMVGQMCSPKKRVRTGRILPARQGACLPLLTPTIRPSTNSELIQAPGHHRGPMLPPQVPPPQADSDFSTLNANAGVPSLLTHPLMDMGFPHADLPRCERVAMDAIHQIDAGFNMSSFGAGPSFSMPPRSCGADMSISLNEDPGFRKPSTKPYLHRREGLKPGLYITHRLDNHAEKFAIAVRDRLEAAEELVQVAKEAAGAKQKIRWNSLAKAKENLTKASDEAANEEKWFRRRVGRAEFMSKPYLMWHRHWQEKRSSQKQRTILLQEERSLPEKRKRSRAQEERSSEMSWKKISLPPSRSSSVIIRNYSNCLWGWGGDTE